MPKLLRRLKYSGAPGFTLLELLIVLAIIVALAAAIVPQVLDFSDSRTIAQRKTENDTVQAAFDLMMAEKSITTITANTGPEVSGNSVWTALPTGTGGAPLYSRYIEAATSTWFYCWDKGGQITFQQETKAVCTSDN